MVNLAKIFGGILLIAVGIAIIYVSNIHHLIEIFNILGIIIIIIGAYLFILSFFESSSSKKLKSPKKISGNDSKVKKLGARPDNKNNPLAKDTGAEKKGSIANLGSNFTESKLDPIDRKKLVNKVKDVSKGVNPKSVLQPMLSTPNENIKKFKFTPNYEKPMKVTRRPQKRNNSQLGNLATDSNINDNQNTTLGNTPSNFNNLPGEKSEKIARALASDDFIEPIHNRSKATSTSPAQNNRNIHDSGSIFDDEDSQDFTIDDFENEVNNGSLGGTDSSKFLSSYVVCTKGTMTSKEAFDELAKSAKSEITIEMPSIKDMTNEFLSKISSLDVRIIIQEFDIKDMSYILLITSFLEQGVKIRTLPVINTINLVADDSHALIISANDSPDDLDIGAVYNDTKSISHVKSMFEQSWNLANDLNVNS